MKLIIDIPEKEYNAILNKQEFNGTYSDKEIRLMVNAINDGIPLDKIITEIKEQFDGYDICEWFEDYDYEENNISEYRAVGNVTDILRIIDKYNKHGDPEDKLIESIKDVKTDFHALNTDELIPPSGK